MADLDPATPASENKRKRAPSGKEVPACASPACDLVTRYREIKVRFLAEKASLEAEFLQKAANLYTKRSNIVNGVKDDNQADTDAQVEVAVPYFWFIAMNSNEVLAREITERDIDPLKYLKDISWSRIHIGKGFQLSFHFGKNPYFTNDVLTKTYHMNNDGDDEPFLEKVVGTKINWISHLRNVTEIKYKGSYEQCISFFNFFKISLNRETITADELQKVDDDFHIGCTIRDNIIPHAVSWFTGEYYEHKDEDAMKQSSNLGSSTAFQGVGGSSSNVVASKQTAAPVTLSTARVPSIGLVVDDTLPSTSIRLKLLDGTHMVACFNRRHTVGDIHAFIDAARPGGARTYQLQAMGFPPKPLPDVKQTIEEAAIGNSVLIQKPFKIW